ncbi:SIMPL domain-containing protein [Streptomyces sp. VRA16 Mangrove soil]|uniref:SIMPL domain-containing protein n=1 Tax=Streptomyces sp. VRA16 Mangrove soil TaxID=2817434 RepID=UPI001A9F032B|nr:SIMPL domain-containing protein [Streptomyces sp. VRA16 Mangrove soil]MBO1329676.1 SIMPL domain-containing protein [Streptomyces sp. VRA16 Mangrove soil]
MTAIKEPWGLSVFGAGSVSAEPVTAHLKLAVDHLAPTPKEAFAQAGGAVSRLRGVLRDHRIPDAEVSGSRLALRTEHSGYGGERTFVGYRCEATYTLLTRDLDRLEELIQDAVEAGANRVDDVLFEVENKPAMRDEARRRAVAAARRKAEVYAEACAVRLGPVVHIQDVDPESMGVRSHSGRMGGDPESDGVFTPGTVKVEAAVLLGFGLLP